MKKTQLPSSRRGLTGCSMQIISIKPKRKGPKLSEMEKIRRGIGCAKGSNLKFIPNEEA